MRSFMIVTLLVTVSNGLPWVRLQPRQEATATCNVFCHPGILHTADDFTRVLSKVQAQAQPWYAGWQKLTANSHSSPTYSARPAPTIYRGSDGVHAENYALLFNDIAAAYQNALRWKISGNTDNANKAIGIMDAWRTTLKNVTGNTDRYLAYGIYGYEFANAAEIMRSYSGWPQSSLQAFVTMLNNVFLPGSTEFLYGDATHPSHHGAALDHYWSNWDLCNIAFQMSFGVLSDNRAIFDRAVNYFKTGGGNGNIEKALWHLFNNTDGQDLAQDQESGRDQGHALLSVGMIGIIGQIGYNQGNDLFAYLKSRILAGSEYTSKFNVGLTVPYTRYDNSDHVNQTVISNTGRKQNRPIAELIFNHYDKIKGLDARYTGQYRDQVVAASGGAEGGGGDYGPNSGGYDFLGFGTLMYSR